MKTLGSDGDRERRQENSPDAPVRIPQFREVPEEAESELIAMLARLGDTATLADLRDAVAVFARGSRSGNVPPEHMLIRLKQLLRQARAERGVASAGLRPFEQRVVEEAIADYFANPST